MTDNRTAQRKRPELPPRPLPPESPALSRSLDPFDLLELELDRGRAAEDRHADLHPAAVEIELLDQPVEAGERTVEHLDAVADLIVDADLLLRRGGGGFVLGVEDARGLGVGDRLRLAARAQKAGHLRRVLDEVVDV